MLRALIGNQLRATLTALYKYSKTKKNRKLGNKVLIGLVTVYLLGSLGLSMGFFMNTLLEAFAPLDLLWLYFALAGISGFVLSFIGSVFLAQSTLFAARDNDLLLSLPIPPGHILISRTAVLYLMALGFQSFMLVPALVVWLLKGTATLGGTLILLAASLLLPLLTLTLSIILGWALAVISARIKRKNLIVTLASLLFLGAYFWAYSRLMGEMNNLLAKGSALALTVQAYLFPAFHFGQAVAQPSLSSLLLFALCCLLPFVLVMALLSRRYLRVLTTQRGSRRERYKGGLMRTANYKQALLKKELRRFFGSPVYLMNSAIGLVFLIALPFLMLFDKSGTFRTVLAQFGLPVDTLGNLLILALGLLAGSVFISAPSVSLEGKNLWILQSLPVSPLDALMAKVRAHTLLCLVPILFSGVFLGILFGFTLYQYIMALALPGLISVFTALMGILLNLRFPRLSWRNETEPVKQSMSTFLTMTLGFLSVLVVCAAYFLLLNKYLGMDLFLLLASLLFLLLSAGLYLFLRRTADKAWLDLSEA